MVLHRAVDASVTGGHDTGGASRQQCPGSVAARLEQRAKVLPAIDVLRSACVVNAELLGQTGKLGCIREGAIADLLVLDGNPLEDMSVLGPGRDRVAAIMKDGLFHKRML